MSNSLKVRFSRDGDQFHYKANSSKSSPQPSPSGRRGEGVSPLGDLLTPDERGKLAANFQGYDISPDMVRLSLVNMYLHGFADPHIFEYDTLTSQDRWNEYADVIEWRSSDCPYSKPQYSQQQVQLLHWRSERAAHHQRGRASFLVVRLARNLVRGTHLEWSKGCTQPTHLQGSLR